MSRIEGAVQTEQYMRVVSGSKLLHGSEGTHGVLATTHHFTITEFAKLSGFKIALLPNS